MAKPIQMPALSPTMEEGKITRWLKKAGDKVSSGEAVAEIETDKSNLEIESYEDGHLLKIVVEEGASVKVGAPIAWVGEKGEQVQEQPPAAEPKPAEAKPPEPKEPAETKRPEPKEPALAKPAPAPPKGPTHPGAPSGREGRLLASPLAKRIAREKGVDLAQLEGSGPSGRIVKRDVEGAAGGEGKPARAAPAAAAAGGPGAPFVGPRAEPRRLELGGMRKVIAQRMVEVKPGVPHFYLTIDIEMEQALKIREEAKASDQKLSVNDIIVKAAALALHQVPQVNVSFNGDHLVQYATADIGIAVAVEDGLITPVIRDADRKGLLAISAEARALAQKARGRKLKPEEYSGGSLTVSNLGMYGIDQFVAVINPPQASIIAVGAVTEKVVVRDGQMVVRKLMTATFSGDHRAIDGALGALYLQQFRTLLEHPLRLLF
jgi:pyruvate dehydrogenase E2 component (dihydrolipoamide acetyltransferase)